MFKWQKVNSFRILDENGTRKCPPTQKIPPGNVSRKRFIQEVWPLFVNWLWSTILNLVHNIEKVDNSVNGILSYWRWFPANNLSTILILVHNIEYGPDMVNIVEYVDISVILKCYQHCFCDLICHRTIIWSTYSTMLTFLSLENVDNIYINQKCHRTFIWSTYSTMLTFLSY